MKHTLITLLLALAALGASAKDIHTLVVTTTPQMHCQNCEQKIKNNIKYEKGVKKIETSIEHQTVTITYDADRTSADALVRSFEKFGYKARLISNTPQTKPAKQRPTTGQAPLGDVKKR